MDNSSENAIPFQQLSNRVSFYRPEPGHRDTALRLLILCPWMDASPRLVNKYAQEYVSRFPQYTILVIRTNWKDMFITSSSKSKEDLEPAVNILLDHIGEVGKISHPKPIVDIYGAIYSNGGVSALTTLYKAFRTKTGGQTLNMKGLVLDSCPGPLYLSGSHGALSSLIPINLRRSPLKQIFDILLWIMLFLWAFILFITGATNPITKLSTDLNDPNLFDAQGKGKGQRTYIYSMSDNIVHYDGPQASAEDAEEKGWKVKKLVLKNTKHVAHAMGDKDEYWKVVQETLT